MHHGLLSCLCSNIDTILPKKLKLLVGEVSKLKKQFTNFLLPYVISNLEFSKVQDVCVMYPLKVKSSSFLVRQKWIRTIPDLGELTFSLLTLARQVTSNTLWSHLKWCVQTGKLRTQPWPLDICATLNHNPVTSHSSSVLVETIKHESNFLYNCVTSEPHVKAPYRQRELSFWSCLTMNS